MDVRDEEVKYCPRCGAAVTRAPAFGQDRAICPACGWIHFADPKVAAAVLVEEQGRVLLIQRANEPFRGLWTLPAGFVNAGEDPARAAERECVEETGLIVQVTDILEIRFGREHPRGADFVIFYRGQADSAGAALHPADDAEDAGWFSRSELPPLAFVSTGHILAHF